MPNGTHYDLKITGIKARLLGEGFEWNTLMTIKQSCERLGIDVPSEVTEKLVGLEKELPVNDIGNYEYVIDVGKPISNSKIAVKIETKWV